MNPDKLRTNVMSAFILFGLFFLMVGVVVGVYANFIQPDSMGSASKLVPLAFMGFGLLFGGLGWVEIKADQRTLDKMRAFLLTQEKSNATAPSAFEPLTHQENGNYLMGIVLTFVGLGLMGAAGSTLHSQWQQGVHADLVPPLMSVLLLFGLALLFFAQQDFYSTRVTVSPQGISYRKKALIGAAEWQEPLSRYIGIRKEYLDIRTRRRVERTFVFYLIHERLHAKTVVIGAASLVNLEILLRHGQERQPLEALAKMLQLPIVEEAASGGFSARYPQDLDSSVQEQQWAGTLKRSGISKGHIPR